MHKLTARISQGVLKRCSRRVQAVRLSCLRVASSPCVSPTTRYFRSQGTSLSASKPAVETATAFQNEQVTDQVVSPNVRGEAVLKPVVVHKFGGSSVGNATAIRNVASLLLKERKQGRQPVAVLSAVYGVTNQLLNAMAAASRGEYTEMHRRRSLVHRLHSEIAEELLGEDSDALEIYLDNLAHSIESAFSRLELSARSLEANLPPDEDAFPASIQAEISSVGEVLSVPLVHAYLESLEEGCSVAINAREMIIVDDVSREVTSASSTLVRENIPVDFNSMDLAPITLVTGYICSTTSGDPATLGRGGSDYTATLIGSALKANAIHLWKVECDKFENETGFMKRWQGSSQQRKWLGVLSADPSKVEESVQKSIDHISYAEAHEFAHFGKQVLHQQTMEPLHDAPIPVYVRNTSEVKEDGTKVTKKAEKEVKGIVNLPLKRYLSLHGKKNLFRSFLVDVDNTIVVTLIGEGVSQRSSLVHTAIATLAEQGIQALLPARLSGSANHVSLLVSVEDEKEATTILHRTML